MCHSGRSGPRTHSPTRARPPEVSRWIQNLPRWAAIQIPTHIDPAKHLGLGEREAIALALELKATQLLVDDRAARQIATQRGLLIAGTVGILEQAAGNELLNLSESLCKLLNTNFRIKTEVVREVLDRDAARRRITGAGS